MSDVKRTLMHNRQIDIQGYLRDDGLWEVEGELRDTKSYPFDLIDRGLVQVGGYLHHMKLTLVYDERLTIHDVRAEVYETPYFDCPGAKDAYQALIGIRIRSGWIDEAKAAVGKVTGCTHLTELLPVLATGAIQTLRGYQIQHDESRDTVRKGKDLMLNSCYGFREGGRAQTYFWPEERE